MTPGTRRHVDILYFPSTPQSAKESQQEREGDGSRNQVLFGRNKRGEEQRSRARGNRRRRCVGNLRRRSPEDFIVPSSASDSSFAKNTSV